jgi:spore coat polysaccharide biosynthesis protein SpsF
MNILVVIQARTGSSRLPGKVMLPAAGSTVLARMLERVRAASMPTEVAVATTERPEDEVIVDVAHALDTACIRGHATDLLDRHVTAARVFDADIVVKIPSDCPLIDPATIDRVIGAYLAHAEAGPIDYVSNLHPPSWPDGFDVEVMSREALELAYREARRPLDREHTTPFLWDNPGRFAIANVTWGRHYDASSLYRLTLDYLEDYQVIRDVFEELWSPYRHFTLDNILELLVERPQIAARNACYAGTSWMDRHRDELTTLIGGLR